MKPRKLLTLVPALLAVALVAASGCTTDTDIDRDAIRASTACQLLCKLSVEQGRDLSAGPCLNEHLGGGFVCDIAHAPRQAQDGEPANQCQAYRNGSASRFVELDEYCDVIAVE